jgi:hypothetical protein
MKPWLEMLLLIVLAISGCATAPRGVDPPAPVLSTGTGKRLVDVSKPRVDAAAAMTKIKPLKLTIEHKRRLAIRVARLVVREPEWNAWADAWLSGRDRSYAAAVKAFCLPRPDAQNAATYAAYCAAAKAESVVDWALLQVCREAVRLRPVEAKQLIEEARE